MFTFLWRIYAYIHCRELQSNMILKKSLFIYPKKFNKITRQIIAIFLQKNGGSSTLPTSGVSLQSSIKYKSSNIIKKKNIRVKMNNDAKVNIEIIANSYEANFPKFFIIS